jgi:poly(3-hydroxybutyrate) depolymerase
VDIDGAQIVVFTYRPVRCGNGPLLLVCHGMRRNAEGYRDHAQGLADRCGMLVAAPLFDQQ